MSGTVELSSPSRGPVCGWLGRIGVMLRQSGWKPATEFRTGAALIFVRRLHSDAEQPPPLLAATFCPFCGEAYQ